MPTNPFPNGTWKVLRRRRPRVSLYGTRWSLPGRTPRTRGTIRVWKLLRVTADGRKAPRVPAALGWVEEVRTRGEPPVYVGFTRKLEDGESKRFKTPRAAQRFVERKVASRLKRCECCERKPGPTGPDRFGGTDQTRTIANTPLGKLARCPGCGRFVCPDCGHERDCCDLDGEEE